MTTSTAPQRWALIASLLIVLIGLQWWAVPESYPYGAGDEPGRAGDAAVLLGSLGVLTARGLAHRLGRIRHHVAMASAAGQSAVLGYLFPALIVGTGSLGEWDGGYEDVATRALYVIGSLVTGALWLAIATQAAHERGSRRVNAT